VTDFPYPPDDPAEVGAIVAALHTAARSLAEAARGLLAAAARPHPGWQSGGGDAALAEIGRLGALCSRGLAVLHASAGALGRYQTALLTARSEVDGLRRQYDAALLQRSRAVGEVESRPGGAAHPGMQAQWTSAQAGIERSRQAGATDLATVSGQTARVLHESTASLAARITAGRLDAAALTRLLARQLPIWGEQVAQGQAQSAARALDPKRPLTPQERANIMRTYGTWQRDPVFAGALLQLLGPARFRTLLADAVPPYFDPIMAPTLDGYYGFLGTVLGSAPLGTDWLAGLTDGLTETPNHLLRIGLGLALRHGTYRADTIAAIAPPLYAARGDTGVDVRLTFGDPLVGVMHALGTNPAAAGQFLRQRSDRLSMLLSRVWREDAGTALGAMLAAAAALHDDTGAGIATDTVRWVGQHPDAVPEGFKAGLGRLLGEYIDDVNHGLIDLRPNSPTTENPLPTLIGPPHAQFQQLDVARALYVAMQSADGAADIYAHQAVYAAAIIDRQLGERGPSSTLAEISLNYGRLSKIHELALTHDATVAHADEQERLRNRTTWVTMATMAAGAIPIPGLMQLGRLGATAVGLGKGIGLSRISQLLKEKYYATPLEKDAARRNEEAQKLTEAEEHATRRYVAALAKRLGSSSSDVDADRWISSQSVGAGRDNAELLLGGAVRP